MRLLIVDDEDIIRRGLESMDWGKAGIAEVLTAADGLKARQLLEQHNVAVVISDIRMPSLDGLELAAYVAASGQRTRVILLTGFEDFTYAQQAIRHGVSDYILKPADPAALLETVKHAVDTLDVELEADRLLRRQEEAAGSLSLQQQILGSFRGLSETTRQILLDITEGYAGSVSLKILAEQYHFAPVTISRMVKKETGHTFIDILTGVRLLNAARLLREEPLKVGLVCERVGIGDQRYFSQVFRRVYGCTPVEYRKRRGDAKDHTLPELLALMERRRHSDGLQRGTEG